MRWIFTTVLGLLVVIPTMAQQPIVRANLEPSKDILVGQPVRLAVTVLVPNYFTGSPDFPELELENAIVVLPQERAQNSNETLGGVTYAGITETYTIYPQQPGDFQLPPVEISAPYASSPPQTTVAHLKLPALTFHANIPAAAQNLDYFLPTTGLTIEQKWSVPLKNLRAGDVVERTIAVTAVKMQGMLIPPLPFDAPEGIRVYAEEPSVQDQKTNRGDFVFGRRTQSAKYFVQKAGDYTLPPIELKWWNLNTNRLVTANLPAVRFSAEAGASAVAELPPELEPAPVAQPKHISFWTKYRFWIRVVVPCTIAFILLLWMFWRYTPRIHREINAWRERRAHSESAYFRRLHSECERNRPEEAYAAFLKWLEVAYPRCTVSDYLSHANDSSLSSQVDTLGNSLFSQGQKGVLWKGQEFAALLALHRKTRLASPKLDRSLIDLNP